MSDWSFNTSKSLRTERKHEDASWQTWPMPRQKVSPALSFSALPLESPDVMEVFEGMASDIAMDSVEAMSAAMDFEKALLTIAHTLAEQAIRMGDLEHEAERVKAAERQVKLLGKLYTQLQQITQVAGR